MADAWSSFNVALWESFHHVCANTSISHSWAIIALGRMQTDSAAMLLGLGARVTCVLMYLVRSSWRVVSASPRVLLKLERASNRNSYCQTSIDYLLRNGTHWKRLRGVFLSRAAYRQHQTLRTHLQHPRSKFVDRRKHLHHSNQLNMPQNDFDRARYYTPEALKNTAGVLERKIACITCREARAKVRWAQSYSSSEINT